jgi:hemolysin III
MMKTVVNTRKEFISAFVYGSACILLFIVSSIYHLTGLLFGYTSKLNRGLQKADHTMIYLMIASSYTPWLLLIDFVIGTFSISQIFMIFIWSIAVFGLIKSSINLFPSLKNIILYMIMGWVSAVYILLYGTSSFFGITEAKLPLWGMIEVGIGGIFYTVGAAIFFRLDGVVPFSHAIWHLFTVVAAAWHCHAIHVYAMSIY